MGNAASPSNIKFGFRQNGMIDKDMEKYPNLHQILATCRQSIDSNVYDKFIDQFPYLYKMMLDKGTVPEEVYDELGFFPKDMDQNGNIVERNAGIGQENRQRAKCLTHSAQVEERAKRIETIQREHQRVQDQKREKEMNRIETIKRIRDELLLRAEKEGFNIEGTLEDCTVEHFSKLSAKDLHDFIVAYDPDVTIKNQIKGLKKDTLKAAEEALENNTPVEVFNSSILQAYRCRRNPCKIDLAFVPSVDCGVEEVPASSSVNPVVELVLCSDTENILPSQLMSCGNWVGVVSELFNLRETIENPILSVNQEVKDKADVLVKYLRSRLSAFMSRRNVTKARQQHWAIQLANKNLSVIAAFMVIADHVKTNLQPLDETHSLLSPEPHKFIPCEQHKEWIGAYAYRDENQGIFIRSGKSSAKGFCHRHNEHRKEAMKKATTSNRFYSSYPTKCNPRYKTSRLVLGCFDDLKQYIVAGFDPKCELASRIDKSYDEGGIMILSQTHKEKINASMKQTPNALHKYHTYLSYLFELGYDLAIAPSHNVSDSFGFESFVGLFGAA